MAGELLITAPRVVPGTGEPTILEPGYVLVTDGRVAEVGRGTPPRRPDLVLGTGYLVPGLIDLQVNGYFGVNLADAEPAGWALVARRYNDILLLRLLDSLRQRGVIPSGTNPPPALASARARL